MTLSRGGFSAAPVRIGGWIDALEDQDPRTQDLRIHRGNRYGKPATFRRRTDRQGGWSCR
jgi:hypothetical protein